jgi:hypothetical protein
MVREDTHHCIGRHAPLHGDEVARAEPLCVFIQGFILYSL